jgi:hypothetical protein
MAQTLTQLGKFFRPTGQGMDEIVAIRNAEGARDIYRGRKMARQFRAILRTLGSDGVRPRLSHKDT